MRLALGKVSIAHELAHRHRDACSTQIAAGDWNSPAIGAVHLARLNHPRRSARALANCCSAWPLVMAAGTSTGKVSVSRCVSGRHCARRARSGRPKQKVENGDYIVDVIVVGLHCVATCLVWIGECGSRLSLGTSYRIQHVAATKTEARAITH